MPFSSPLVVERSARSIPKVTPIGRGCDLPGRGSQRPLLLSWGETGEEDFDRDWDREIEEIPVRNPRVARALIEMFDRCDLVGSAVSRIVRDVFSSQDGDDIGFAIADTLNDNRTPVDPEVKSVLDAFISEVIGGKTLAPIVRKFLLFGDAFVEPIVHIDRAPGYIQRFTLLPTWDMFRIELNDGRFLGYEQRRFPADRSGVAFSPVEIVHWRFQRQHLYGRGLFYDSIEAWEKAKATCWDLSKATRNVGINPTVHELPESEYSDARRRAYRQEVENRRRLEGTITDFYTKEGGKLYKLSSSDPDLSGLVTVIDKYRSWIIQRSQVPSYLLGSHEGGAQRDIATQPALAYARFIGDVRGVLAEGMRQLCNIELALHGIQEDRWQYRFVFPKIIVNPWDVNDETDSSTVEDQDD